MDEKEIKEILTEIPAEERAKAWEEYVRTEINSMLDIYLPESVTGNIGIKYEHPVKRVDPATGAPEIDDKKATGVYISIMFEFARPIDFYDEEPVPEESE